MSNFTKLLLTHEIFRIYLCFHHSCEIWHSFHWTPMRNFLWCYYRWLITYLALEKCKKNAIFFKLFWFNIFCPLKVKITQFLGGFSLKSVFRSRCSARFRNLLLIEWNMSLVYCVVQSSFRDSQSSLLFYLELKRLFLIHLHNNMKAVFINHISKVNRHVWPHFLTNGYC